MANQRVLVLGGNFAGLTAALTVKPLMAEHPYAILFFFVFILFSTFVALNLFIGIIVNAVREIEAPFVLTLGETEAPRVLTIGLLATFDDAGRVAISEA